MTYEELTTSPDYIRLHKAVVATMIDIAYSNASALDYKTIEQVSQSIEDDVDAAFTTIDCFIEAFDMPFECGVCDTVTRRCAKSEIHSIVRDCIAKNSEDSKFDVYDYVKSKITAEEVFEDFIHMNTDDDSGVNHLFTQHNEVS
jgi:hypothetical protein